MFANSFCKPLDPATPAAKAARTPSGPPTLRITASQNIIKFCKPGLTFMGLGSLIHCGGDYDDTRSSVGICLGCGHRLVDSWNHAIDQLSSPNQVDDSLGNNPLLSGWSLGNQIRPFQHEGQDPSLDLIRWSNSPRQPPLSPPRWEDLPVFLNRPNQLRLQIQMIPFRNYDSSSRYTCPIPIPISISITLTSNTRGHHSPWSRRIIPTAIHYTSRPPPSSW
jgi:hypothetical protein